MLDDKNLLLTSAYKSSRKTVLVAAIGQNNEIGYQGELPWSLPLEMKQFRLITLGKTVVMGRKTFSSIGFPLKDRKNIVLSRDTNLKIDDVTVCHSIDEVLTSTNDDLYVIGGASVYELFLPIATHAVISKIHSKFKADTFFNFSQSDWTHESSLIFEKDLNNEIEFEVVRFKKNTAL